MSLSLWLRTINRKEKYRQPILIKVFDVFALNLRLHSKRLFCHPQISQQQQKVHFPLYQAKKSTVGRFIGLPGTKTSIKSRITTTFAELWFPTLAFVCALASCSRFGTHGTKITLALTQKTEKLKKPWICLRQRRGEGRRSEKFHFPWSEVKLLELIATQPPKNSMKPRFTAKSSARTETVFFTEKKMSAERRINLSCFCGTIVCNFHNQMLQFKWKAPESAVNRSRRRRSTPAMTQG